MYKRRTHLKANYTADDAMGNPDKKEKAGQYLHSFHSSQPLEGFPLFLYSHHSPWDSSHFYKKGSFPSFSLEWMWQPWKE